MLFTVRIENYQGTSGLQSHAGWRKSSFTLYTHLEQKRLEKKRPTSRFQDVLLKGFMCRWVLSNLHTAGS